MIEALLRHHRRDEDGIFVPTDANALAPGAQASEIEFRRQAATTGPAPIRKPNDSLARVAEHHAIPVMDREAERFLATIPADGAILDIGGGLGWPWRRLAQLRPDVKVVVVDLLREHLMIARSVLGDLIGQQIYLAHGNACRLAFDDRIFDGVWTVQTLQHIAEVATAYAEAARVLKPGGLFVNYALNDTPFLRLVYRMAGRPWHREGKLAAYFLRRMSAGEKATAEKIFGTTAQERFTEVLFSPELRLTAGGRPDSLIGRFDAIIGGGGWQRLFARQHSLYIRTQEPPR